ncbi:MAG TPA: M1 family metallopeptidase [Candidatus Saccharimonadales bacterium]|nr:M1 family metallopeptidase [Candidatus Saccharimonadales bacterium]
MTKAVRQLTTLFTPNTYTLSLDFTKQTDRKFSGTVSIDGVLLQLGHEIILHSKDLTITSATIDGKEATWKAGKDDEMAFTATGELAKGQHVVTIGFEGAITDPMHGIYPCYFKHDGKNKELIMTQLESHYAREAFPCVDEPLAKATFDLTLTTAFGVTVLGNTPVRQSRKEQNALVTSFEPTPKMSPYLLAFVFGELSYTEMTNKNGVLVRCYATPDNVEHTRFALDFAARSLEFLDNFFGTTYPLPKCDLVAVPDFAAGAMENWGLITFRENAMLFDEKNSSADLKEWVAAVVMHELSHQWFGNLVTMKWWDDLWLNESFAKWMEHYGVDKLMPEWRIWDSFGASEQQYAFNRDGLANVQAVRQPVKHPDELHSLFDPAIVYAKGACLIRMLQGYLGEDVFRDGLRLYMAAHKYGNTSADDLWAALDKASGKDVSQFMKRWIEQPGHPVVSVASPTPTTVAIEQRRFYANAKQAANNETVWPLPLLSDEIADELLQTKQASFAAAAQPVIINRGYTGFYHTHYQGALLDAIAMEVKNGKLPVVDRQGLLIDNIALARAGVQSTADVLKLLAAYTSESSFPVWQAMSSAIGAARTIVNDDPAIKPHLQKYVAQLVHAQYDRLGWDKKPGEPYFDELLRPSIIGLMAYAEVPAVIDHLLNMFDAAQQPEAIAAPELRSIVFAVAVRERGRPAYERLLEWYKTARSADERVNLTVGMTSMRDPELAKDATKLFTSKLVKPQDLAYWFIYTIRNRHARSAAWDWMINNWDWITKQFKNSHDYADFPKYSSSALATREELEQYKAFFEPKLNESDIAMVIRQGIEEIETRVLWRERDLSGIADYLKSKAAK